MAGNPNRSSPSIVLWEEKQLNLEVVRVFMGKFPRLKLYSPEWKGGALYLVEKGVKDNIAGKGEWKVAKFKPRAKGIDDWKVFWYDSSGSWKWEPIYGEGTLKECLEIISQNEMGLFLG